MSHTIMYTRWQEGATGNIGMFRKCFYCGVSPCQHVGSLGNFLKFHKTTQTFARTLYSYILQLFILTLLAFYDYGDLEGVL